MKKSINFLASLIASLLASGCGSGPIPNENPHAKYKLKASFDETKHILFNSELSEEDARLYLPIVEENNIQYEDHAFGEDGYCECGAHESVQNFHIEDGTIKAIKEGTDGLVVVPETCVMTSNGLKVYSRVSIGEPINWQSVDGLIFKKENAISCTSDAFSQANFSKLVLEGGSHRIEDYVIGAGVDFSFASQHVHEDLVYVFTDNDGNQREFHAGDDLYDEAIAKMILEFAPDYEDSSAGVMTLEEADAYCLKRFHASLAHLLAYDYSNDRDYKLDRVRLLNRGISGAISHLKIGKYTIGDCGQFIEPDDCVIDSVEFTRNSFRQASYCAYNGIDRINPFQWGPSAEAVESLHANCVILPSNNEHSVEIDNLDLAPDFDFYKETSESCSYLLRWIWDYETGRVSPTPFHSISNIKAKGIVFLKGEKSEGGDNTENYEWVKYLSGNARYDKAKNIYIGKDCTSLDLSSFYPGENDRLNLYFENLDQFLNIDIPIRGEDRGYYWYYERTKSIAHVYILGEDGDYSLLQSYSFPEGTVEADLSSVENLCLAYDLRRILFPSSVKRVRYKSNLGNYCVYSGESYSGINSSLAGILNETLLTEIVDDTSIDLKNGFAYDRSKSYSASGTYFLNFVDSKHMGTFSEENDFEYYHYEEGGISKKAAVRYMGDQEEVAVQADAICASCFNDQQIKELSIASTSALYLSSYWISDDTAESLQSLSISCVDDLTYGTKVTLPSLTEFSLDCPNTSHAINGNYSLFEISDSTRLVSDLKVYFANGTPFVEFRSAHEVTFGEYASYIAEGAFKGNSNLASVDFENLDPYLDVEDQFHMTIGANAFNGCTNLQRFGLYNAIKVIGNNAFDGCASLNEMFIGRKVETIGAEAFKGCSSLQRVFYYGTASQWADIQIGGNNGSLQNAEIYFYSATKPNQQGNYWHFDGNSAVIWNN